MSIESCTPRSTTPQAPSPAWSEPPDPRPRIAELERQITELAGHLNAAQHRFLMLIAQFDRLSGWNGGGTLSCAHSLNWKCGIDLGAAREKVRVAHALQALPLISAAMAAGELSYSKVRALTRVATAEIEQDLLMMARHGTAQHVERLVRGYRRAQEATERGREAQQWAERSVNWFHDDDGSLVLKARLPAEAGAVLLRALEAAGTATQTATEAAETAARNAAVEATLAAARRAAMRAATPATPATTPAAASPEWRADVSEETPSARDGGDGAWRADVSAQTSPSSLSGHGRQADVSAETSLALDGPSRDGAWPEDKRSFGQHRADALVAMAESFLKHGLEDLRAGERQQVVIHVDAATLVHEVAGRCEIEAGPAIAAETARRLSCDASVLTLVEDAQGQPLDIGRKRRTIPPAIGRALRARDRGCRFPGCGNRRFVDAHHIAHWAQGGPTRLSNLVLLCRFHHRQVHEGNVRIRRLDDGALQFSRPEDGHRYEAEVRSAGSLAALLDEHEREGLRITPQTAATRWCGERMDYGLAVAGLMLKRERALRQPEGPS